MTEYLIKKQGVAANQAIESGQKEGLTPLYIATTSGRLQVVQYLIEKQGNAANKTIKRSQQIGAEMMKDVMGDLNFPGMG